MARSYAHIYLTIWNDPDFRTLTADGQWLYFVMLTHPTITNCGVIEWRESRLVSMAADMTPERLRQAAWELAQRRMIAVDVATEEALVRSFVRHDGVLKSPNVTKSMVREHGSIASLRIMELVSREARRATEEEPDAKGSELAHPVTKQFMEPISKGFEWVPDWFKNGSNSDTPQNGEGFRFSSPVPTPYPLPHKESSTTADAIRTDPPREDVEALCSKLSDRMVSNGYPAPTITKTWRTEARLLIDKDGRDPRQAQLLIDWAHDSSFWKSNIKSMPKFREQYDTLRLQAEEAGDLNGRATVKSFDITDENGRWKEPKPPSERALTPRRVELEGLI